MSEIQILNLCHNKLILVDIYRQLLLISIGFAKSERLSALLWSLQE